MAVTGLIVTQLLLLPLNPEAASALTTLVLALFFWASMLGIPVATRRGAHLSLVFLRRHVSVWWQRQMATGILAATLTFFVVLAWSGTRICIDQVRFHNRFLGTDCPDWVVAAAIPVAAVLSCVRAFAAWWEARQSREG
jgi:TRAP-type C4-dicarboxylate transport system permease small subunit